jgi:hypothetical protein
MNIIDYDVANYSALPKSTFDGAECVIVKEIHNEDHGYGHHNYEGIGVNAAGAVVWCYSSGCSCNGDCGVEHENTEKSFVVNGIDLSTIDPADLNFDHLQVQFASY